MRRLALAFKALFGRDGDVFTLEEVHSLYIDTRHQSFNAGYDTAMKDFGIEPARFYESVGVINGVEVLAKKKH